MCQNEMFADSNAEDKVDALVKNLPFALTNIANVTRNYDVIFLKPSGCGTTDLYRFFIRILIYSTRKFGRTSSVIGGIILDMLSQKIMAKNSIKI